MANNVITATYSSSNITYTKPAYQYDYGMILKFSGIDLPQAYEVHFSNTEFCGESISQIGDETGVTIPDEMFLNGNPIYAWTYLHTGEDDGETVYKAVIGVNKRAKPSDLEPTPVQQDVITQAIAALNTAVEQTAQDVIDATAAKDAAETAQGLAESARDASETAQGKAEDAQEAAENAQEAAETAQGKAENAQEAAEQAAGAVLGLTADASVDANTGTPSVEVNVSTVSDHKNMSFSFHNLKGDPGEPGDDGFSPVVSVSSITGGHEVAVTDKNGTQTFDVMDGTDGEDGVSPTVTVTEITGGHEVEVVDAQGTQTFDVMDGEVSEEQLETALIDKADIITSSASGEIVTISDGGKDLPVVDLSVSLLPVQDLHGYDSPWPAGGGKNLCPDKKYKSGANSLYVGQDNDTDFPFALTGGTTYTLSFSNQNQYTVNVYIREENASSGTQVGVNVVGKCTFTPSASGNYRIAITKTGILESDISNVQLELGSTVTTYAPYSNVCPISGWTGVEVYQAKKNLIYPKYSGRTNNGITYVVNSDGTITATGTASRSSYCAENLSSQPNKMQFLLPGTYRLTGGKSASMQLYLGGKYVDGTSVTAVYDRGSGATYTFTKPVYVYPQINIVSGTVANDTFYIQLERGSSFTEYENHQGTTYPISWQSEAGTVYGGTLDVTTGKLTVTDIKVSIDSFSGTFGSTPYGYSYYRAFNYYVRGKNCISNMFKRSTNGHSSMPLWSFMGSSGVKYTFLFILPNTITTLADANAWLSGLETPLEITVVRETPQVYQLSENQIATLLGTNNFWSNGNGTLDLEYRADTKLYIQQLTKPSEDDMVANANIQSGKFFIIGNRLMLSTTAIAQGEQIVVGTNCSEVSLADALNQINS